MVGSHQDLTSTETLQMSRTSGGQTQIAPRRQRRRRAPRQVWIWGAPIPKGCWAAPLRGVPPEGPCGWKQIWPQQLRQSLLPSLGNYCDPLHAAAFIQNCCHFPTACRQKGAGTSANPSGSSFQDSKMDTFRHAALDFGGHSLPTILEEYNS